MLTLCGQAYAVALALGLLTAVWWIAHGLLTYHTPGELAAMFAGFLWRLL